MRSRVKDDLSEWFSVEKGVKQGCILSPLLFGLFINALPSYLKGQFDIMFDLRTQSLVCIFCESSRERNKLLSQ